MKVRFLYDTSALIIYPDSNPSSIAMLWETLNTIKVELLDQISVEK